MGMTPLEGLMMGTRSGDVDFGAMAWIAKETGQTLSDLERVVNKESGLLGISGLSSDLRVLEKAWHEGHERRPVSDKKRLSTVSPVTLPDTRHRYIGWMALFLPAVLVKIQY
ncbi:propionate/acetate kinase [Salmonella enterica subsp. enterica]|nr:propionate/acetate kinase [Salmonella enterica subsp. enterica] [Salmonella enterica subsp. enterica serovar Menston]